MAFFSKKELIDMKFKEIGNNVLISKKASIYNPSKITIGSNVRIDDFCVLSPGEKGLEIGNYVHIAIACTLVGRGKITLKDFSGISSRVSIYSSSDDYSGGSLTNPTVPKELNKTLSSDVYIGKHVIIGAGSVVLPGVTIQEGAAIGALSLVNKNCESFKIYSGTPIRYLKNRKKDLKHLEEMLLKME